MRARPAMRVDFSRLHRHNRHFNSFREDVFGDATIFTIIFRRLHSRVKGILIFIFLNFEFVLTYG